MNRLLFASFALLAVHSALLGADEAPDWVRQAAAQQVPTYPAKVTSVVLLREESVAIDLDGKRVMRERGVVKLLQKSGEGLAAHRYYNTKTGRVRDFQGWLLAPGAKPVPYAKNRVLDVAVSREYVYDETRVKILECGSTPPGSIFAWEVSDEEKTSFTQDSFDFQDERPVLTSRFIMNVPAGWEARGIVLNGQQIEPRVSGNEYTWEMRNLPWLEDEDYSPSIRVRAPWLGISYYPPADNRGGLEGLKDWPAVSNWVSRLVDPASEVTEAVRSKALQLTANATSEIDKIRAIAAFVQQTNYVEVSLNITHGGGYTPRPANDTLAKNYGDCKDKAALMRALLKAAGIDSYAITIFSGDRHFVQPGWATPMTFNHAIVAVRVSDAVKLPAVLEDQALGRLLIFDPTDPFTLVGDLPESEQGSNALILAGARGSLVKMPMLPPSAGRIESSASGMLDASGRMEVEMRREYFGQSGSGWRAVSKTGDAEVTKRLERIWGRRLGAMKLDKISTTNHPEDNRFSVSLNVNADHFGQIMQNRLLVVRPGLLAGQSYAFTSKQRNSPVELSPAMYRDSIRIKVPGGFQVDELPAAAKLDTAYGMLETHWSVENNEIHFEQTLEIRDVLAPASDFVAVRDFFERVNGAVSAPVVFVKQ